MAKYTGMVVNISRQIINTNICYVIAGGLTRSVTSSTATTATGSKRVNSWNHSYRGMARNSQPEKTEKDYVVGHDQANCEFYLRLPDAKADKAILQYQRIQGNIFNMYHTGVPPAFRGKGIAKILAKEAMDYVVAEDGQMILSCTYLQKYIKDNPLPQYMDRLVSG